MPARGQFKNDIVGRRFGRLLVTSKRRRFGRRIKIECVCACGKRHWSDRTNLLKGNTRSCGCLRTASLRIGRGKAARNRVYRRYKSDARRRGYRFSLSIEEFEELTQKSCRYCGSSPSTVQPAEGHNGNWMYNGIDRIDNDKGYELSNCAPCCNRCNLAKGTMLEGEFIKWVELVYQHVASGVRL